MEMALRSHNTLCPRSRPTLVVTPIASGGGGGSGFAQSFLGSSRTARSRIIRLMVASSDCPNRKSRRTMSPNIKVTAFKGYAPRLTIESSIKKIEHHDSDEEALGTCSRMLSTDSAGLTSSSEVETVELDLPQIASSSSTSVEVDVAEEAGLDLFDGDFPRNALINISIGKDDSVDGDEGEEDKFEVDLLGTPLSNAAVREADETKTKEGILVDLQRVTLNNVPMGRVGAHDEVKTKEEIFVVDLPGNASSNVTMGEVDVVEEAKAEEGTFTGDLSEVALSSDAFGEVDHVDAMDEAKGKVVTVDEETAKEDTFEVTLSRTALSSAASEEVVGVDEAKAKEDIFVVDTSRIGPYSDATGELEVVDEPGVLEDIVEADLLDLESNNATIGEMDLMDEAGTIQETFGVDLSSNASSRVAYVEVAATGEFQAEGVTFETISGTTSNSAKLGEVAMVDEARIEKGTSEVDLSCGAPGTAKYMSVDFVDECVAEEENSQQQYTSLSARSMENKDIDETPQSLKAEPMPLVSVRGSDKRILSFYGEEGLIVDPHEEDQPASLHKQEKKFTTYDEQNQLIPGFPQPDLSIAHLPEQKYDIIGSPKEDQSFSLYKEDQSIASFHKQDQSIADFNKQEQSVDGSYTEETSNFGVPEHTQFIVGSSKLDQSIVRVQREHQSIIRFPEQKQSIIGFQKPDLSIVGISRQVEATQVAIVGSRDSLHVKGMEANNGDGTSQETNGDKTHVKFDVDSLFREYKEDTAEVATGMITRKKTDEEHLTMTEEQKSIRVDQQQQIHTEEGIVMPEVEMGISDNNFMSLLSEKDNSWVEDEVVMIDDENRHENHETSIFSEQVIQELPQDDVDPQALQIMLQELVEKNSSLGNKLFVFPELVKADSTIDVYLNRDLSALANEPNVLIKGGFNGWKWRIFTERLHKSELGGNWWCCKLYIPKQAYRLDFVFFNGRTIYENNGNNDYVIQIQSDMSENLFEDFLVEEKRRELERLSIEESQRRAQTEEQRRREEERAADEADKAQAKAQVEMKRKKLLSLLSLAKTCVDNLWYIEPITTRQRTTVRLYYNRNSRPLIHSTEIWMHGGYNNWIDGLSFAERLVRHDGKDGDWWYADVTLPERAYVLDWVFADGSPGNAKNFDNNGRQDFHAILLDVMTEEEYWVEEEQRIYRRLLRERSEMEEASKRKAEKNAKMKAEMKEKTMKMFLVSQKHIVYTEPLEVRAGTAVDVLYNPSNTVLTGKPEVWFRCSFNRWMHPSGVLAPQKMVKAKDGSHLKATVNVPVDAYVMDFVFSESEDGGIYDNRNGLDYHIPVFGSIAKEPPKHIVHIAVEMAPIAKVGGLGDVVTSLSRAVQDLGHNVEVIIPKHDCLNLSNVKNLHVNQSFSWGGTEIKVWFGLVEDLSVYFLEPQNGMFGVGCVYGRNDDRRFGFFCHSAVEFLLQSGSSPHIIHCHDWSSAPVTWLYKEHYAQSSLANARVVFTIHNLEFGAHYIGKAMKYCDKATTVSNTYSREVAGHGAIAPHLGKFYGILNGIDPDLWDPYTDTFIPVHYTSENVVEGKDAAKKALQQKLGLQQNNVPIVGIVTRLTAQKGIHLIKHAIHRTLEWNGQVVLLGSAPDPRIQNDFCNFANTLQGVNYGRVKMCLAYDEPLSHLIYAGSDFILVPSIFEPCGLTQLVAMRYGSIPIVRKTGGLYDTVFDVDHDKDRARARGLEPNGFSFDGADANGVDYALNRAITAWFDAREWFQSLCKRVMEQDWSWNRPALDYIELYRSACKF